MTKRETRKRNKPKSVAHIKASGYPSFMMTTLPKFILISVISTPALLFGGLFGYGFAVGLLMLTVKM